VPLALTAAIAGLGLGLSLIVAIGAQNAFVLRQGLRREHVIVVVAICAASDALLIVVGVGGLGTVIQRAGWALVAVRIAGAAFLTWYGVRSAMRAAKPGTLSSDEGGDRMSLAATVTTVLALTWLNPHVYLDTVLLLGSIGGTYGASRWWFALGAALGSVLWFSALGFGSRALRPLFARPVAWRILDAIIAIVMVSIAVSLIVGLFVG
jgi:L-lysine exporter family protein LysE/ArgO